MRKNEIFNGKRIFFIGIGGIGISSLAKYCLKEGYKVYGSDLKDSDMISELSFSGAKIFIGHNRKNAYYKDVYVYNSAIDDNNPELDFALCSGKPVYKRSEFLNLILKKHKNRIAVSGCHGKTTTTSMLAHIFISAGKNPTCFIGGNDLTYGNFVYGANKEFAITEACEFKKNLLDIDADSCVILNIDKDHMDCYADFQDMIDTYASFVSGKTAFINADDVYSECLRDKAITFSINSDSDYKAENLSKLNGKYAFDVSERGKNLGRISLNVPGYHNIYNALCCVAVARQYGLSLKETTVGIESFTGVLRRMEKMGERNGKMIYSDYAHHPKEIETVINEIREYDGDEWSVVFQPHTFSRTKYLLNNR